MDGASFLTALLLSAGAGLSTTVGSVIAIFFREPGPRHMAFMLGFSAGVMVLVSFVELLSGGIKAIGFAPAHFAFFAGMLVMLAIDFILPHNYILEDERDASGGGKGGNGGVGKGAGGERLKRAALLVAIGIGIHNFPEGMVTMAGALTDVHVGIALAVAVAIHNIPEGIAVSVPIYAATRSAGKAFFWSFISGASEIVGALVGGLVLLPFLSEAALGWALCLVAGFMVFISLDELLPVAHSYGEEHVAIIGAISGMAVMAGSLYLLL